MRKVCFTDEETGVACWYQQMTLTALFILFNICSPPSPHPPQWTGLRHPISLRLCVSPPSLCISVSSFAPLGGVRSGVVGLVHTSPIIYDSCQEGWGPLWTGIPVKTTSLISWPFSPTSPGLPASNTGNGSLCWHYHYGKSPFQQSSNLGSIMAKYPAPRLTHKRITVSFSLAHYTEKPNPLKTNWLTI